MDQRSQIGSCRLHLRRRIVTRRIEFDRRRIDRHRSLQEPRGLATGIHALPCMRINSNDTANAWYFKRRGLGIQPFIQLAEPLGKRDQFPTLHLAGRNVRDELITVAWYRNAVDNHQRSFTTNNTCPKVTTLISNAVDSQVSRKIEQQHTV